MFVSCVYMLCCPVCGLCDGLITRPEESCRVSNSVRLNNLKVGGQGPIWAVAPLDGCMDGWLYFQDYVNFKTLYIVFSGMEVISTQLPKR
jgi:hypothetical protein